MESIVKILPCSFCFLIFSTIANAQNSPSCESLTTLSLPHARIVAAEAVPAGAFKSPVEAPPWMQNVAQLYKSLPAFCRVAVHANPSSDSDILIEVWLPAENWNGKFQAHGNGGFAGELDYPHLATSILSGYATSSTDTGHTGTPVDAAWALGHPEKVTDFGFRAIHVMTEIAKQIIQARFASAPRYSYFLGCSNGGRQALMEAQRYPADYNGILAGAPANFWTHLLSNGIWNLQALTNDVASYIPASKLPAIAHAVNAACDAQDGVADGILNDPRKCKFRPETMLCKNGDAADCLTTPQITALKKLYEGGHDAEGKKIFPGFLPGAEEGPGGWFTWITGPQPGKSLINAFTYGFFADILYQKPEWNLKTADLSQAVKLADEKTSATLNATDANLAPFRERGAKLIVYHGWNDPAISALNTIDYFGAVRDKLGAAQTESFLRLYMLPGVQHCSGGPGPDLASTLDLPSLRDAQHNVVTALETWVEKGTAPSTIIATKYISDDPAKGAKLSRPVCAYPQSVEYKGSGDPNNAANFSCAAAEPSH